MTGLRTKHQGLLAVIFALVVAIGLPTLVNAQGRGHGRGRGWDKKAEKFRNGHDARDGRWDGRGRRNDRDDDFFDDDDRRDRRWRLRNRVRNNDLRFVRRNRRVVNRYSVNNGYSAGYNAGLNDRAYGERFSYGDEYAFRNANGIFRDSFRRGYENGYRSGRSRSVFLGSTLGRRWR